ncbi:MAG: sigma-70 family RNA polymerase sigma factor [Candidatus Lokiarchaeota archaeon]|nr:sigma-70 family RNA polymerase sigma factor [Candidatus Lokiarchaeota archaeon]
MSETNNHEKFNKLIRDFSQYIQFHIYKYNPQKKGIDPDDISQEIQIKLWKIINKNKNIQNQAAYIRKVVNSTVIDFLRKKRREEGIYIYAKESKISEIKNPYLDNELDIGEFKRTVDSALESLIDSRRKVVKLFLLNMTIEEISIFFNWSKNKTRNLLYRGLADLKKILKEMNL